MVRHAQGVDAGIFVAAHPVRIDESHDTGLFQVLAFGCDATQTQPLTRLQQAEMLLNIQMSALALLTFGQGFKQRAPLRRYAVWSDQPVFIEGFNKGGVTAVQMRRLVQSLQQISHKFAFRLG